MAECLKSFILNVKKEIKEKGWSISHLARVSKVPNSRLSEYLSGKRQPTFEALESIAKALNRTPGELLLSSKELLDDAVVERMASSVGKYLLSVFGSETEIQKAVLEMIRTRGK